MTGTLDKPNFTKLANAERGIEPGQRQLIGNIPTIALTPVVDGRTGAYEDNLEATWRLVEKVYDLISENIRLPDGTPIRLVTPPEIVYGPRTGAIAQQYYSTRGVTANIWISRSWAYSDELMSAAMGIGSSEWQQAAYGLNQTDRPGAVWLKAFCAAMDEKKRPIFSIYSPDLEDEAAPLNDFVSERLLRFARCAAAVGEMRGKNYLSVGGVSMGIIGSDVRRNMFQDYLGMGTVSYDMVGLKGRMEQGLFDHEELKRAVDFMKSFEIDFGTGKRPNSNEELLRECCKMAIIVRDLMVGNPKLADPSVGKAQGFRADVEFAQGANAIAAGTQGQRQWTDLYPNFDLVESILNSSFDWNGYRAPYIVATENDSKNAIGMLVAGLITRMPQLFADIRTNWTPESIEKGTGIDVSSIVPRGIIDKRNSGAGALDYGIDVRKLVSGSERMSIQQIRTAFDNDEGLQKKLIETITASTTYMAAILEYFPGDGLSSYFRTPGGIPMTAYRYNTVGGQLTCSVVEGETVEFPSAVADHIRMVTDNSWPETFWTPRGMSSFEYMNRIGPNHDGNSFGLIGADMITVNAMLRIPIDMHNVPDEDLFRPTIWDRFANNDYRVCEILGPVYT